jgi:selenocysteine lyase/cysteine desulfurase
MSLTDRMALQMSDDIEAAECRLAPYATDHLRAIPGIQIVRARSGRVTYTVDGMKPQDVELALDCEGIIVVSGSLNARISMGRLALPGAVRAAFVFYNTEDGCDSLWEVSVGCRKPESSSTAFPSLTSKSTPRLL